MYKVLLCWRYLRSRFIVLPSVISVMLGVACIIIVNSVMGGFATEMRKRIRGALADIIVESRGLGGMDQYPARMARIRELLGDRVQGMAAVGQAYGLLNFTYSGEQITTRVMIFGIEPGPRCEVSDFQEWINRGRWALETTVPPGRDNAGDAQMQAWLADTPDHARLPSFRQVWRPTWLDPRAPTTAPTATRGRGPGELPEDEDGLFMGVQLATHRMAGRDVFHLGPGASVILTTFVNDWRLAQDPTASWRFRVTEMFKSGMSEYDSSFVYVPLAVLQKMRNVEGRVNQIQIKLDDYRHAREVEAVLAKEFPELIVKTWEEKRTVLLDAVKVETAILDVLLFLIIVVAGFGILAIFYMIVAERTRDIGIIKALGGSERGVMAIFLGYGLSLGIIGAALGVGLALVFVAHLDQIEGVINWASGVEVFPRDVYYFERIPRRVEASFVIAWSLGAIAISVLASILPARRAARLNPVEALRHE